MKTTRSARFETDFGEPIRDELRTFKKAVRTLRVFTLPAGTAPDQRIKELTELRADWDKAAADVEALLREADDSPDVEADYWGETWENNIVAADSALQQLLEMTAPTDDDIRKLAGDAFVYYSLAVEHARSGIATERDKLKPEPPPTFWEWVKNSLGIA